jgi:hypothetical protein
MNKTFDKFFNQKRVKNVTPVEEEDSDDEIVMTKLVSEINLEEASMDAEEAEKETPSEGISSSRCKRKRTEREEDEEFGFIGAVITDPKEPKTFNQAWNCNTDERDDWREAIRKELMSIETRKVWNVVGLEEVSESRKIIGCNWVSRRREMEFSGRNLSH